MQPTYRSFYVAAAFALLAILVPLSAARADIAPPEQAPGSAIQPEGGTRVQMAAERVVIEVLRVKGQRDTSLPIANVTALFTMRNEGDAPERLVVRFPLTDPSGRGDGWGGQPEIEQVTITVDNRHVPMRIVTTPNPYDATQPPIKWAAFNVAFPPGRDVEIAVEYVLRSTGYPPYGRFKYILETGAGWDGPIGSAEFILKLPYPANEQNVLLGRSTPGGELADGKVRWRFKDIEPEEKDNFYVTVMAPSAWQRILDARRQTEATPGSAAAWRELAQAYLGAISGKYGPEQGAEFVPLVEEAYRHAQENDPNSAQLHAELAQTLLNIYPPIFEINAEVIEKILTALRAAFERDPGNALAQKVVTDLKEWLSRFAQESGAEGEAARAQLEQLEQLVRQTGADKFAATPTAAPVVPGTPEPPAIATTIVTSTTQTGAVITATTLSTATTTLTDTATSQPVVVTTIGESRIITETADVAGTIPTTVTEVSTTTIITATTGGQAAPAASTVITATTTTTITMPVDEAGVAKPGTAVVITTTAVTTATTEASPLEPTQPATVTVIVTQTTISPTITITRPTEAGEPVVVETYVTSSAITTATTGLAEPGAPPSTSIVTETNVITTTIEPSRTEGGSPITSIITATTIVTAAVDASGLVTSGTPITIIVTGTLPGTQEAPVISITGTPEAIRTPRGEATAIATAEAAAQPANPTEAPTAVVAAVATLSPEAAATQAPTAGPQPTDQGIPPTTWIALLLTYLAGGAAVYGIHRAVIRRDYERAEAMRGNDQAGPPESGTDSRGM